MAGGARHKFQGSRVAISTAFTADSPTPGITAITKANPAVVTDAGHNLVDGSVIKPSGIVGMTELNGGTYIVNVLSSSQFELVGVDSSGYTTYVSGGTYTTAVMSNFCELTALDQADGATAEIDVSTICSDDSAEFESGIADPGTTTLDYNFAPLVAVQAAIKAARTSGAIVAVRTTLPSAGGQVIQLGTIQQTSMSGAVNGVWKGSTTIRNSGAGAVFA